MEQHTHRAFKQLAACIGARLVTPGRPDRDGGGQTVGAGLRVYAGDRVSDLLSAASDASLLVTNLSNSAVVRLIELMDVPGVCLCNGTVPDASMVAAAEAHGTALLVSPAGLFETCGRLYGALGADLAASGRPPGA